jgi:hypothetical protein
MDNPLMSQMTISEPTALEHERAGAYTPPTLEQFAAELEASAPPPRPRDDAPSADGEECVWRLPRTGSGVAHSHHPQAATVAVQPKEDYLKLGLMCETAQAGTRLIAARRELLAEGDHTRTHSLLLDSPEHARAAIVLPQHAAAERKLKSATARLEAVQQKRAKLVATPPKAALGKQLVELDAQVAAASAEVEAHGAEVKALTPAVADARAALLKAAATHCQAVKNASYDARLGRLSGLLSAFFAAHGEELTEIAVVAATRSADAKIDAASLVRTLERDMIADPDSD